MDKKDIYEKAEKAINIAFDTAKQSVKVLSEKAGEAAQVTKLLIEKATLEHKVSKKFAELGGRVYEKAIREGEEVSFKDGELKELIEQTKNLDVELAQIEATIERERQQRKADESTK